MQSSINAALGAGLVFAITGPAYALSAEATPAGPFVCTVGDSDGVLTASADGSYYMGTLALAGDHSGMDDSSPAPTVLAQKYFGWITVYHNDEITMVIDGGTATLYGAFGTGECATSSSIPVGMSGNGQDWTETPSVGAALAWGGNVRSGPGEGFARIASVRMGAEITTLAVTDRLWLGEYPWFRVRLPDGREGYIAGGLLCSRDGRDGMFNARNCGP